MDKFDLVGGGWTLPASIPSSIELYGGISTLGCRQPGFSPRISWQSQWLKF
jgi:hypothetical protein